METDSPELIAAKERLREAEETLEFVRRRRHLLEYENEALLAVEIAQLDVRLASMPVGVAPDLWASATLMTAQGRKGGV